MPLNKSWVNIPLFQGPNTKTDEKLTEDVQLKSVENGEYVKDGVVQKRYGFTSMTTTAQKDVDTIYDSQDWGTSTILSDNYGLSEHEGELLAHSDNKMFAYKDIDNLWFERGTFASPSVESKTLLDDVLTKTAFDMAVSDDYICIVWHQTDYSGANRARYAIVERATKEIVVDGPIYASTAFLGARVICDGTYFHMFVSSTSEIEVSTVPIATPYRFDQQQNIVTGLSMSSGYAMDVVYDSGDDAIYLVYESASSTIKIERLAYSGTSFSSSASQTDTVTNFNGLLKAYSTNDGDIHVCSRISSSSPQYTRFASPNSSTINVDQAAAAISGISSPAASINSIAAGPADSGSTDAMQWYIGARTETVSAESCVTYNSTVNSSGTVQAATELYEGAYVIGDPQQYNGMTIIPCLQADQNLASVMDVAGADVLDQQTILFVNQDGVPVAHALAGRAGHDGVDTPAARTAISNGEMLMIAHTFNSIEVEDSSYTTQLGLTLLTLDWADALPNSQSLGGLLYSAKGGLQLYDGRRTRRYPFSTRPTIFNYADSGSGSFSGSYKAVVVWEWTDAQGNRYQSAPSDVAAITASGSGSGVTITFNDPSFLDPDREISAVLYQTTNGGSIFYRTGTQNNGNTIASTISDPSSNEILYTGSGELENTLPPPSNVMAVHQRRIFLATEDGLEIRYSKEFVPSIGIGFNEALGFPIESSGGRVTALASLDSRLVIFKKDRVYAVTGTGPSVTGVGATYSSPQIISQGVGAIDQNSIATIPQGIVFKSVKGIYLLTRSLQVQYIGGPVEDYNSLTVVSADVVYNRNEVRFATSSDKILVFNYELGRWSWYTGHECVDAVSVGNNYYISKSAGTVLEQDGSTYTDDGVFVSMKLVTAWVKKAAIQGLQRIYRAMILGNWKSAHTLKLKAAYDFDPTIAQTQEFDCSSDPTDYQYEARPDRQKCTAVQYTIEDAQNGSIGTGEGYSANTLSLQVGVKRKPNTLANSRRS